MNESSMPFRIVPTMEELKSLREKFNNINDLSIFKKDKNILKRENLLNTKNFGNDKNANNDLNLINENATMVKTLQKLLKLNDENNNNKLYNEIKNYHIPEKEMEIQNQRFYEIQAFIEANKQKIEQVEKYDEMLKENIALKAENEKLRKSSEYLKENKNIKDLIEECIQIKTNNITLQKELDDERKTRLSLEKQLSILKQLESNKINTQNQNLKLLIFSLLNQDNSPTSINNNINNIPTFNYSNNNLKLLHEIFNNNNINNGEDVNFTRFLGARVDALEFQNFKLASKHEKYSLLIGNYIEELIEFIEILSDIRNVVNQVFESQSLTKEFLIIRETLNSRDEYLEKQKKYFVSEKEKVSKELNKDLKYQILLSHDKITENYLRLLESEKNEGLANLLEEKIEEMQNLKSNLALYEDFLQYREENQINSEGGGELAGKVHFPLKLREGLLSENGALKVKFLRLKSLFMRLAREKSIELDDQGFKELNAIMNSNYDVVYSEELFGLMKAQALLMEQKILVAN